jgi:hypothetical protein
MESAGHRRPETKVGEGPEHRAGGDPIRFNQFLRVVSRTSMDGTGRHTTYRAAVHG